MINGRRIVALCISRLGDNTSFDLISSLNTALTENNSVLFIYNLSIDLYHTNEKTADIYVFDLMDFSVIDAVVIDIEKIKSPEVTQLLINKAHENNIPVIIVDGHIDGLANVNFDFSGGFEKIVRHVIEFHGKKKIHYMAGQEGNPFSEERYEVIKKVMDEHGLPFGRNNVSYGDFWETPTKEATLRIVESGNIPEAVICANDVMAINVSEVFQYHGIRVPDDVIVTGFDGISDIYFSTPRITSCNCSHSHLGNKIADVILRIFNGESSAGDHYIEPTMILSGSCGCGDNMSVNTTNILYELNNRIDRFQDDNRALSRRSEKIQNSRSLKEVAGYFDSYVFFDMTIFINSRCIDPSIDPMSDGFEKPFDDTMCLLHYFDDGPKSGPLDFRRKDIIPNIEKRILINRPFVFSVIEYMSVPIGYAVFNYGVDTILTYSRLPMVVTALNNGLGGYLNIQRQRYLLRRIEEIYRIDSLTGLLNRMAFSKEFEMLSDKVVSEKGSVTAVLADLDDLKGINDNCGHIYGDKAIKAVADALRSACPEDALFVRLGGDEMMAVISGVESSIRIKKAIDSYLEEFSDKLDANITVSASVGIYITSNVEEMRPEILIKRSDELMYEEKRRKKIMRAR